MTPNYVYVASSWRNSMQPAVVAALRAAEIDCYDFKNPEPGNVGFQWSEVMARYPEITAGGGIGSNSLALDEEYLEAIKHPIAQHGFRRDMDALERCDTCVLILPCGRSAHLELGWAVGAGKKTAILLDGPMVTPELMYLMVDHISDTLLDLLGWLGVED